MSCSVSFFPATLRRTDALHVRPITVQEEPLWNDLMGRYHYLGFQRIVGESMKYVAVLNGTWAGSLHLLSAFLHREGIVIGQKEIAGAGGEIPGARQMLKDMDIRGMVVTADALHTQHETAAFLVKDKRSRLLLYGQGQPKHAERR